MNKRLFIVGFLFLVAIAGIYLLFKRDYISGPKISARAPEFSLPNREGKTVPFNSFRGKVVLLNFWATWCGPCRQEMPSLEALAQHFQGKDFSVLGVSLDEEGWTAIDDFLKQVPVQFPILLDAQQATSDLYQVFRIPETYLIDTEGNIVDKFVGPQNYDRELFFTKIERYLPKK